MIYSKAIKDYDPKDPLIEPILPFKGPHGDQFYATRNPITGVFGITKDSKNAETAFKFLDYAIGPEAQDIYTWGDKDVTYTEVDGKKQWTDKGKDNAFIQQYGINPVNMPIIQGASGVDLLVPKWHVDMDRKIEPYVKAPFPFVYDLPDEASLEDQTMPDINTFVNEKEINFITGKENLDQFDNFEKTLKSMNIEAVIQAKQAQYDRFQAALKK
jgi:putative aldouronate transport system substrate-binding protein